MKFRPIAIALLAGTLTGTAAAQDPVDIAAGLAALSEAVDVPGFSGAVMLTRGDEVLFSELRGEADRAAGRANDDETRFNIASAGKFITALALVRAGETHGLRPDEIRPADWFPDHPDLFDPNLTADLLLAHATTARSFFSDNPSLIAAMAEARSNHDVFELAAAAQVSPVTRNPNGLAYSNTGLILAGELIERLTGETYEDFVRREIFDRAGADPVFARTADAAALGLALGYLPAGYDMEAGPQPPQPGEALPTTYPETASSPLGDMVSSAAGGLYASANDMAAIGRAALDGEIISRESLDWMCTSIAPLPGLIFGRGCGGREFPGGNRRWGHNGGAPGINAEFALYPDDDLVLVILSNHDRRATPILGQFEAAAFPATGDREGGGFVIRE